MTKASWPCRNNNIYDVPIKMKQHFKGWSYIMKNTKHLVLKLTLMPIIGLLSLIFIIIRNVHVVE